MEQSAQHYKLEIDQYISLADILGQYSAFTDILVSAQTADFISLIMC